MTKTMTKRQFAACMTLSLLSPLIRVLPGAAVRMGGRACWLSAVPAFGVILLFALFTLSFLRKTDGGMGDLFLRCLGPAAGRAALVLYGAAFLLYTGFLLRVGADRFITTVYPDSGPTVFYTVMLLLCLMAAMGRLRALGRTAVILLALMLAVLALAFVSSFQNLDAANLLPLRAEDLPGILLGAMPMVNVGSFFACLTFLFRYTDDRERRLGPYMPSFGVLGLLCFLLCLTVVGSFGPALTKRMSFSFFILVRDLSILNLGSRIAAFIVALWVFSDFCLGTLLLRGCFEALRLCFSLPEPETAPFFSLRGGRWLLPAEAVCVWFAARFIARSTFDLQHWSDTIIPLLYAGLILAGLPLVWLIGRLRKKI